MKFLITFLFLIKIGRNCYKINNLFFVENEKINEFKNHLTLHLLILLNNIIGNDRFIILPQIVF